MPFKTSFPSTIIPYCPQPNYNMSPFHLCVACWPGVVRIGVLGATCAEKVLNALFNTTATCVQLVLVRLWSSTDYGGLEMDLKGRIEGGKRENLSVVLEKLCLSRIRDTNMLIIVSQRTAKKHFPCNPLIRHYTSEHTRYRSTQLRMLTHRNTLTIQCRSVEKLSLIKKLLSCF